MNEFSVLLDTARMVAWVSFCATFLLAAGLAIFEGRATTPAEGEAEASPERRAA